MPSKIFEDLVTFVGDQSGELNEYLNTLKARHFTSALINKSVDLLSKSQDPLRGASAELAHP